LNGLNGWARQPARATNSGKRNKNDAGRSIIS
jgi:hypothetical protein